MPNKKGSDLISQVSEKNLTKDWFNSYKGCWRSFVQSPLVPITYVKPDLNSLKVTKSHPVKTKDSINEKKECGVEHTR